MPLEAAALEGDGENFATVERSESDRAGGSCQGFAGGFEGCRDFGDGGRGGRGIGFGGGEGLGGLTGEADGEFRIGAGVREGTKGSLGVGGCLGGGVRAGLVVRGGGGGGFRAAGGFLFGGQFRAGLFAGLMGGDEGFLFLLVSLGGCVAAGRVGFTEPLGCLEAEFRGREGGGGRIFEGDVARLAVRGIVPVQRG